MRYPNIIALVLTPILTVLSAGLLGTRVHGVSKRSIGFTGTTFGPCSASTCAWSGCTRWQWSQNGHGCGPGQYLCGNERSCAGGGWQYKCCETQAEHTVGVKTLRFPKFRKLEKLFGKKWNKTHKLKQNGGPNYGKDEPLERRRLQQHKEYYKLL